MDRNSTFAMIHSPDQWHRAAFQDTTFDVDRGVVQLAWELDTGRDAPQKGAEPAALVFDPWCRLYRSIPEEGRIERSLWGESGPQKSATVNLFAPEVRQAGQFTYLTDQDKPMDRPCGLAVDEEGRLFAAETGKQRVLIYDVIDRRLLRRVVFGRPVKDLAFGGWAVFVLLDDPPGLAVLTAFTGPRFEKLPAVITRPSRVAVSPAGEAIVLNNAGVQEALAVPVRRPDDWIAVPSASDIEFLAEDVIVAARTPGQDFLRFRIQPGSQWRMPFLYAPHYDGRGIVRTPDGSIGYWGENGFTYARLAAVKYIPKGRVISFRLDSGQYQSVWGRMFLDACIPKETSVSAFCYATDDPPENAKLLKPEPPANVQHLTIHRPDLTPPMPPKSVVEKATAAQSFHRRDGGREFPWMPRKEDDGFETYEAPVMAEPGRYLWVVLELNGKTRRTPKIKSLRVEYPSHQLLNHLPRIYRKNTVAADFLRRYLAILEGALRDLDLRSVVRHLLLDPWAAPKEMLPWLAAFMGLVLDERWPGETRRELIKNAVWLFRYRGTVMGLQQFLEIYLNRSVIIIEHFKVRGLGGAVVGKADALASRSILGGGFRVGGRMGLEEAESINDQTLAQALNSHAHRFSVVIPVSLDSEQEAVVKHILEVHRPCHTVFDICTVDAGMKAGVSLYVQLTTIVGRTSGFGAIQVGDSLLGRTDIVGRPTHGTRAGSGRLGRDTRMG